MLLWKFIMKLHGKKDALCVYSLPKGQIKLKRTSVPASMYRPCKPPKFLLSKGCFTPRKGNTIAFLQNGRLSFPWFPLSEDQTPT